MNSVMYNDMQNMNAQIAPVNTAPFKQELSVAEIDRQIKHLEHLRQQTIAKELKGKTIGILYVCASQAQVAEMYMRYIGRQRNEWRFVDSAMKLKGLQNQTLMFVGDTLSIKNFAEIHMEARTRKGFNILYLNDR